MRSCNGPKMKIIIATMILASGCLCAAEARTAHGKAHHGSSTSLERAGGSTTARHQGRKRLTKYRHGGGSERMHTLLGNRFLNDPRLSSPYSPARFHDYPPYGYPFSGSGSGMSGATLGFYNSPYVRYSTSPFTGFYGWYGQLNP